MADTPSDTPVNPEAPVADAPVATKPARAAKAPAPEAPVVNPLEVARDQALASGVKDAFVVESPNPGVSPALRVDY